MNPIKLSISIHEGKVTITKSAGNISVLNDPAIIEQILRKIDRIVGVSKSADVVINSFTQRLESLHRCRSSMQQQHQQSK